jgi:hypothetical protein
MRRAFLLLVGPLLLTFAGGCCWHGHHGYHRHYDHDYDRDYDRHYHDRW